eukprot:scaffold356_cov179-Ochromonas_danica.AAC.1
MAASFSSRELDALYAIYNATHGQAWEYTGNPWNFSQPSPDPCGEKWQGISCVTVCSEKNVSASGGSVSGESNKTSCENVVGKLEFNNMYLAGTLPEAIGNFPFMTVFNIFTAVNLYGTLPASIGKLTSLQSIYFLYTSLSGPIPSSIENLYNLNSLTLTQCHFTGTIPEELYHITSLTGVNLADNYLHGTLSPNMSQLSSVTYFDVDSNILSGSLPQFSSDWASITQINAESNLLEGTIPDDWANMLSPRFDSLILDANLLTGPLPTSWSTSNQLYYLSATNNFLQGEIPIQLFQPILVDLYLQENLLSDLRFNHLSGTLPGGFGHLFNSLDGLVVSDNLMSGTIPAGLGNMTELSYLLMDRNLFYGTVPSQLSQLLSLKHLSLSTNILTGSFHALRVSCRRLARSRSNKQSLFAVIIDCFRHFTQSSEWQSPFYCLILEDAYVLRPIELFGRISGLFLFGIYCYAVRAGSGCEQQPADWSIA